MCAMIKIVFSGYHNPHFITITEYVERAIRGFGYQLVSFDNRRFLIPGRIRDRFPLLEEMDLKRINHRLIRLIDSYHPQIFLETGGYRILPETVEKIKKRKIKTVLWTIDVPRNFQPIIEAAFCYDFVFCGGTEAIEILEKHGLRDTYWLPFACDPEIHKPVCLTPEEKQKYGSDVVFVGSFYPNRLKILESILDFNLAIWGPGWDKVPAGHPLKNHIKGGQLKPEEWRRIYSAAKIILVIHYRNKEIPCYQASPKVYEALACGGFILVDDQRDVFKLFKDGTHLVRFYNTADLKDKIKYYLEHEEQRNKIAQQGYNEILDRHTYKHRIEKIIKIMEKGKNDG